MKANSTLPAGLLASLSLSSEPRALLLRHSDRYDIPQGNSGSEIPLTPVGEMRARELGEHLGEPLTWGMSSPLLRCRRTAELMGIKPTSSHHLGAPGPFVVDRKVGSKVFGEVGTPGVVYAQIRGETWNCMRDLDEGARLVWKLLQNSIHQHSGTGVAVSHDAIVMPFIAWATDYDFADDWLEPLDGVVVCEGFVVWRGERYEVPQ